MSPSNALGLSASGAPLNLQRPYPAPGYARTGVDNRVSLHKLSPRRLSLISRLSAHTGGQSRQRKRLSQCEQAAFYLCRTLRLKMGRFEQCASNGKCEPRAITSWVTDAGYSVPSDLVEDNRAGRGPSPPEQAISSTFSMQMQRRLRFVFLAASSSATTRSAGNRNLRHLPSIQLFARTVYRSLHPVCHLSSHLNVGCDTRTAQSAPQILPGSIVPKRTMEEGPVVRQWKIAKGEWSSAPSIRNKFGRTCIRFRLRSPVHSDCRALQADRVDGLVIGGATSGWCAQHTYHWS